MMVPMRRWLLLLMIALLPLRGWVGEALAGQMIEQQVHAAASAAQEAMHEQHAAAHDDCAGDESASPTHDHADCSTCAGCQACSAAMLVGLVASPRVQRFTLPLPAAFEPSHREAGPQSPFKPPIS